MLERGSSLLSNFPSFDKQNSIHQNIYGKSLAITSTEAQLSTTIIENPEMLKYQQERQSSAQAASGPGGAGPESAAPKLNSVMNGESLEDIRKVDGASLKCCGLTEHGRFGSLIRSMMVLHQSVVVGMSRRAQ